MQIATFNTFIFSRMFCRKKDTEPYTFGVNGVTKSKFKQNSALIF